MLIHYNHSTVTEAEKETMTVCSIRIYLNEVFCYLFPLVFT